MLDVLFGDRERPLFEQARPLYLEPLDTDHLADYIGGRFEATHRDAGEALDALLELTRGHPQRAMLAAHHLPNQRKVLAALANSPDTLYDRRTLAAFGLTKGGADSGVRALIADGEVARDDTGFFLIDPLFERWLQVTQR